MKLNPKQFGKLSEYRFDQEGDNLQGYINATHAPTNTHAGYLDYHHDSGAGDPPGTAFVESINVRPEHQRKGVATGMADHLRSLGVEPTFSPPGTGNTDEGQAFINSYRKRKRI